MALQENYQNYNKKGLTNNRLTYCLGVILFPRPRGSPFKHFQGFHPVWAPHLEVFRGF